MGSVYEEITRLETAKADIETAIEGCGVNVPDTDLISTYALYIRQIPSAVFSELNVDPVGGEDKYIKSIKQTNGLIEATTGGLVSSTSSGIVPKITVSSTAINSQANDWILTSTSGKTPAWKKLPTSAFYKYVGTTELQTTSKPQDLTGIKNIIGENSKEIIHATDGYLEFGKGFSDVITLFNASLYKFKLGNTQAFIITTDGKVGIGDVGSAPKAKLHVAGGSVLADSYHAWSGGFSKEGCSNAHILLAGGGHRAVSDFATSSGVVTALGTSGNLITWTKNGIVNTLTVPYATSAGSIAWANVSGKPSFATVATSGSYNDLSNKPSIPTVTDYYWADIKVSSSSSTSTKPTFALTTITNNAKIASICFEKNDEINRYGGHLYLQHRGTIEGSQGSARTGNILMVNNGGNVGIGTPSPAYKLDVVGSGKFSTVLNLHDQRFNYGLAYYNVATVTVTGTIVITLPNGWNSSMNTYEIDLYEYNSHEEAVDNKQHSKIIISGYNYSGGYWANYGYQQLGSYNKGVRLGYNGSKCCILLGSTTTTWSYPQVYLSRVITGYGNQTTWSGGYSISIITSETGYSNIVSVNRTRQRFDDVVANNFRGNLVGNATTANGSYSVYDYNSTSMPIYIGYSGAALTADNALYLAAYGKTSSGSYCIKDISAVEAKTFIGLGNVQNIAFHKRSTTVNGTSWDMAGTINNAAFTIYAPTTAGTSGQVLTSTGGTPGWTNQSSLSVNYANSAGSANGLASTGYGNYNLTYYQTSSDFFGNSGWSHYIIANHGDGSSYYNFTIGLPFWGVPIYKRLEGGGADGWHTFITSENISSQSVNYASSAGTASKVTCTEASGDTPRPIVGVVNNSLYYTSKVTIRWDNGNVTAPTFTGRLIGSADQVDGYHISVVTSLPATKVNNTIYILV